MISVHLFHLAHVVCRRVFNISGSLKKKCGLCRIYKYFSVEVLFTYLAWIYFKKSYENALYLIQFSVDDRAVSDKKYAGNHVASFLPSLFNLVLLGKYFGYIAF